MHAIHRLRSFSAIALLIIAAVVGRAAVRAAESVRAATASNYKVLVVNSDRFHNYDNLSQGVSGTNVDWALGVIFSNNAEIDKVKAIYAATFPYGSINTMYHHIMDDGAWQWDGDTGKKDIYCPGYQQAAYHMRFYADPDDDRNYNITWGYYVLASAHRDWQECWAGAQSGWSELSEEYFVDYALEHLYNVDNDARDFENNEPSRWEGNHYWNNNNLASRVNVP